MDANTKTLNMAKQFFGLSPFAGSDTIRASIAAHKNPTPMQQKTFTKVLAILDAVEVPYDEAMAAKREDAEIFEAGFNARLRGLVAESLRN